MKFGRLRAELAMLIISSLAAITSPSDVYPNPQEDLYRCGRRGRVSWICDPDQVLSFHEGMYILGYLPITHIPKNLQCAVSMSE